MLPMLSIYGMKCAWWEVTLIQKNSDAYPVGKTSYNHYNS